MLRRSVRLRLIASRRARVGAAALGVVAVLCASLTPASTFEYNSHYWFADGPPRSSLPMAPHPSSPIAEVERDCGFSAMFRDGVALWVFCDSLVYEGTRLVDFVNNSAALATPDAPMVAREQLDANGKLVQFIQPVPTYQPCASGEHHFIWPTAATVAPDGEMDRALIYFMNLCGSTGGGYPRAISVGLAELRYRPGQPAQRLHAPLRATVLNPSLFQPGASTTLIFGEMGVYAEGYLYAYRCGILSPRYGCQVARAPVASAHRRSAYEFYMNFPVWGSGPSDTQGWLIDYAAYPLGGGQVKWLPRQQVFAMVWVDEAFGWDTMHVQLSPTPEGEWKHRMTIPLDDCHTTSSLCYAGGIHPQLGHADEVVFSYLDSVHHFSTGRSPRGQLRLISQPIRRGMPGLPERPCWPWFLDVADPHLFCRDIEWAVDNGIVGGFPDGTYRPTNAVSRQHAAAMLWRAAGSPAGPFPDPGFADVPPGHPFRTPIAWLVAAGIASGYDETTFGTTRAVSRQGLAAMLWRAAGSPAGPFPDPGFADVPPGHAYRTPIAWLVAVGIANGYPDGTFGAADPVNRQAMAALLRAAVEHGVLAP